MKVFYIALICISLTGCFTVPGKDRIVTTIGYIDSIESPNCYPAIKPLSRPVDRVEYIPADQSLKSKFNYIHECMINYSWGRGWTDRQNFNN
jgi:hypothetical protein